jgi:hypothetical protein
MADDKTRRVRPDEAREFQALRSGVALIIARAVRLWFQQGRGQSYDRIRGSSSRTGYQATGARLPRALRSADGAERRVFYLVQQFL